MKFTKIIFVVTTASLFSSAVFADNNKTMAIETDVSVATIAPTPIVGSTVVDLVATEIVSTGYRTSKLLRSHIYNQEGEMIGKVDDVIIGGNSNISFAIIAVGGFLGIGDRLVAVPAILFEDGGNGKIILPNATKQDLGILPEFRYAR